MRKGVDKYMSKIIIDLLNKSKIKVEKKNNKLTGKYVKNMRETYICDNLKVLFFKHFDEEAHEIGDEYPYPINHYNVELHQHRVGDRWTEIINAHLIYNEEETKWVCIIKEKKRKKIKNNRRRVNSSLLSYII